MVECRHSPEPLSLTVMSDRVVWIDGQYTDVLYSDTAEHDHRARLPVGPFPLHSIVALEDDRSTPTGEHNGELRYRYRVWHKKVIPL